MLLWEKHTTKVTICIVCNNSTSFFHYCVEANDDNIMIRGGVDGVCSLIFFIIGFSLALFSLMTAIDDS